MTGVEMACGSSVVRLRSSLSSMTISAISSGLTSSTGESCWFIPRLEDSYLGNSSLLAAIGGMISASRNGPGASDFRGISVRPSMPPSALNEADGVSILGYSSPTMLSIRPDNKEGMRTGTIMSNPLVLRPGS